MRKIISTLLAAAITVFSAASAFAEEETAVNKMTLDIDAAIEYALEHSPKIEKAKADVTKNTYSATQARHTYNDFNSSGMSLEEALVESGYAYRAAQIQLDMAKRNLEETKSTLKTDVRNSFYTCLSAADKVKIAESNLAIVQEKYSNAEAEYKEGTISRLEFQSFKLAVTNAQNSLNQAKRTYEYDISLMKNTINMPEDTALTLTGEFNIGKLSYETADRAKELAKSQNAMLSINEGRELAALRMKIAQGWYSSNEYGYTIEMETYTSAMADYYDKEISVKQGIESAYNGLLTLEENISYLEEYTEFLKDNADASYLQYQLGMITSNDYIEAQQKYFKSQNDLMDVQLSYYTTAAQYVQLYSGSSDLI